MSDASVLRHRPSFTPDRVEQIVRDNWGLKASATLLPGERDQNFRIEAAGTAPTILKIANALDSRPLLEAQNAAMERIVAATRSASPAAPAGCPTVIATTAGQSILEVEHDDAAWLVRRLTWLEGETLAAVRYRPTTLLHAVGRQIARVDAALAGFDHAGAHRAIDWDPLSALGVVRNGATLIADAGLRRTVLELANRFEHVVQPDVDALPRAVIHGDLSDHNTIVGPAHRRTGDRAVTGIIDFGDIMHSCRVADLAIALAYLMLDAADPLATARTVVRAYNDRVTLDDAEIAALWGLSCMRLCVSGCMAARQRAEQPDDDYLIISQAAIARTLPRMADIQFSLAEAHLRYACGHEPVATASTIRQWLHDNADFARPIVDLSDRPDYRAVLDLGVDSPLISGDPAENAEPALSERLNRHLQSRGAKIGIARWDEARLLNTGSDYAAATMEGEPRTVHLGLDLYSGEGAPVFAPFDGRIVAFNDNDAPQDYGPVIVLRHETDDGTPFHTLYGHLSRSSLVGLFEGREVGRGERIGMIGGPAENGGWTPHLHFQVIVDLLGMGTAFPGICRPGEREIWKSLSPDPDLLLGLVPASARAGPAPRQRNAARRARYTGPGLSLAYREPVHVVRGWMQHLFDDTGRRFLDAYNNVPHVGHSHPKVVEAGARQMALLNTNTRYLNGLLGEYAERLAATLPDPLDVVYLVNSASEANELALRLARAHTGRLATIVLEHAYHGNTTTLIDISPYKHNGPGGQGAPPWVYTAPIPDTYRGEFRGGPQAGPAYAARVGEVVELMRGSGMQPAAFVAETWPSVAGQIVPPVGYLNAAYDLVRRAGGICIADEVQTAYGRAGSHFYAFEAYGVIPDMVVLGKPIGNGHPIGAVVTTRDIAASFDNGMEFFSTFGGNTVSCAIGLAVLDVMEEEGLMDRAARVGSILLDRLRPLAAVHEIVGDVRGRGMFLGVELVRDRVSLEPAGDEATFVCNRMRDRGVLIGTDGPSQNVLKIRPPMQFDEQDAELLASALEETLGELD